MILQEGPVNILIKVDQAKHVETVAFIDLFSLAIGIEYKVKKIYSRFMNVIHVCDLQCISQQ